MSFVQGTQTAQTQQMLEQAQQAQQQAQAAQAELMRAQAELRRAQIQARLQEVPIGIPMAMDRRGIPAEKQQKLVFVGFLFTVMAAAAILHPIARAIGRRLERGGRQPADLGAGAAEQLQRIEHTVEAMAIEIERLSEGQRFTTKLLASRPDAVGAVTDAERARLS